MVWDGLVLVFYMPVTLGSLVWMRWRWGGGAWLWGHLFGGDPWLYLPLGVAMGGAVVAMSRLLAARTARGHAMAQSFARALGGLSGPSCLLIAAASSIAEELLFRGVLLSLLGLWPSSVLFALAHVPAEREQRLWPVFALVLGAGLGMATERSGGLAFAMAAHFVINALNLLWLRDMGPERREA